MFDRKIFGFLILGGVIEFLTSLMVILSYFYAMKSDTNQGIVSVVVTLNSILVSAASWVVYGERLTRL